MTRPTENFDLFAVGGEMSRLMREHDWAATALGPVDCWPLGLRTAISICLSLNSPSAIWWGKDLRFLCNDAWRSLFGSKNHSFALAAPGREAWKEAWPFIGPMLEGVLAEGKAASSDDHLLPLHRNGNQQEAYFTFSCSPIWSDGGAVGGVFASLNEKTQRIEQDIERLNRDLQRRVAEFQILLDVIPIGIAVAEDPSCRRIWCNPAMTRMLGLPEQTHNISLSAPDHDRPNLRVFEGGRELPPEELPMQKAILTRKEVRPIKHDILRDDGSVTNVLNCAVPLFDEAENVRGGLYIGVDVTEREQSQRALEEAERRFRAVFNQQFQFMTILSPSGVLLEANETCFRVTGVAPADALGLPFWETPWWSGKPEAQAWWKEAIASLVGCDRQMTEELDYVWADGSIRHLTVVITGLKDDGGHLNLIIVEGRDDTDRKRAEAALRQSEQRWRTMAEALPNLLWTALPDGQCDWLSSQWGKYTGIPERQLLEMYWLDRVVHSDDQRRIREAWRAACEDRADYDVEFRIRRHDGAYRWFKTRGVPVRDESGRIIYWFGTCTDIEDMRRAEQQLAEAHNFLNNSLDALSSHIAVLDESGVILAVNDAWRRFADLNHYSGRDHGVNANYVDACKSTTGECLDERMLSGLEDVLHGRVPAFEFEYPCHSPTEQRWFVMRATRFKSPGPVRVVIAHEDVTKRKLAEESLLEADRRKDEFLATLAHELRNPLAPIRNGLQVMRLASNDPAAVEQARAMMERQLGQLIHLVDDLLDLSRISRGKITLRKERVELVEIIQQAIESSLPGIELAGHQLTVNLPLAPIFVEADSTRLCQVFANLLNNSAKYTEAGGRIRLTVNCSDSEVAVSINDNGIGIPPSMLPRVFDIFTQVDRNLDRAQGGLGIGLSIVKRLVEMHGGNVEAKSEGHRKGSEFIVRLPIALSVVPPTSLEGETLSPVKRRRILVVDDNWDAAKSLAMLLSLAGNETETAHDGLQALEVIPVFNPEVVLLDIGMPRLNGYDTARRIRQEPWGKDLTLVALTGWGQDEDRRNSHEAGFDFHLVKPVDPMALERVLAALRT